MKCRALSFSVSGIGQQSEFAKRPDNIDYVNIVEVSLASGASRCESPAPGCAIGTGHAKNRGNRPARLGCEAMGGVSPVRPGPVQIMIRPLAPRVRHKGAKEES